MWSPRPFHRLGLFLMMCCAVMMAIYILKSLAILVTTGPEETPGNKHPHAKDGAALEKRGPKMEHADSCDDPCSFVLVESFPVDMTYEDNTTTGRPLYDAWMDLLSVAKENISIASFYWSLTGADLDVNDSSSSAGEKILKELETLLMKNVSLYVATSQPSLAPKSTDLDVLKSKGAHIRRINFGNLTHGVLHTKFWIVDMKHIYIGSANMDWRSITQVKELGAVMYNCSCLAKDLLKTFNTYWDLGFPNASIPSPWPDSYSTDINQSQPLELKFNGTCSKVYFSASPSRFCPRGRTHDLSAIISTIEDAEQYLYVSVMEYFPTSRFKQPAKYWPVIDDALRRAAFNRHVQIQLLISCWMHTDPSMFAYLKSLHALNDPQANLTVDVKIFIVPVGNHTNIPFCRVNHSKYMITDKGVYIGTSNWSEDYFSSTAGVGLVISQAAPYSQSKNWTIQEQLKSVFQRDWNSKYSISIDELKEQQGCVSRSKKQ
ncbi:5'-3' exonuclease PLD4 isoform X2 [Microcaecilia unicolor]|uniref:Phospholipase D4 isoform X2 n=1 Tax=Microcaecilia unicolor TaxID=1415580 RepID=A0A6P7Z5Y3_9AMPH|nr:phospholipase D4 isoform X2 [Microcaecilia unicolor]